MPARQSALTSSGKASLPARDWASIASACRSGPAGIDGYACPMHASRLPLPAFSLRPVLRSALRALLLAGAVAIHGCASGPGADERIVDVATGRDITRAELLARLRDSDVALLGELHDNQLHHRRRGELIAALGPGVVVVAEHLPGGRSVSFGPDLRASLVAAGFDAAGWRWPVHEPLFAQIARSGATLTGANAPQDLVRAIARNGRAAVPASLASVIDAAPLAPSAVAALDQDLVDGHCGRLPAARIEPMRWAQRARDASMTLAIVDALAARQAAGTRAPVVFVAGNGHVRSDYGVAQLLPARAPQARIVGVAFVEDAAAVARQAASFVWITPRAQRGDPCEGMRTAMPAASAPR